MTQAIRGGRDGGVAAVSASLRRGQKVAIGVWPLIQWAFQRERVSLDFDETGASGLTGPGFGMEYVMIQRAMLGCRVDGGGTSACHPDADVVAAALITIPESLGGRGMAVTMAELARAGQVPDCMIGARPACVPVAWGRDNQHGRQARTETLGRGAYVQRGRRREYDRRLCPVTYTPSAASIASARRGYLRWWGALLHVRGAVGGQCGLSSFVVTDEMPPMEPWKGS